MSKLIFNNDEAEEKEISLSNINQLRSNKSNNSSNKELKQKFNSNTNIPKIFLKNLDKLSDKKEAEDNVEIKFERKSKKFHTIKQDIKPKLKFDKFNKMIRRKRTKTNRQRRKTLRKQKIELPKDEPKEEPIKEEELDEFNDKEIKTKLELILEKKFLPTETLLSYCKCQLYISYDYLRDFENTGLEGILCILVNRIYSNLYLQIYDVMDFKKQFEIELYTNILLNKGYEIASEKFHTIEFPTFCIGINFYTKKKAEEIKNIILNYSKALNSSLFYMYETKAHDSFQNTNIFDYILNPTKYINKNEGKKKNSNEANNAKQIINKNNKTSDKTNNEYYFDQLFNINNLSKKLNYKISSDEQMLSFGLDTEANEVIFETSKGANRFFEHNNIDITMINEEYEKMKEKIKSKTKNNKLETRKTKKSYQEEIKDKENQDKINDILNQIEGLQYKNKNYLNFEEVEEKQKLNNKIKKFNIAKRLAINQKLKINSPPENMVFYEDDSERFEDEEEGEEEEDDEEDLEDNEESVEEEMNNTNENKTENNERNNIIQKGMKTDKFNNIENKDNNNNLLFNSRISAIQNNQKNESEVSSNSFNENNNIKNDINNTNSNEEEKEEKSNTVNNKENDSNNKSNSADD